MKKCLEKYGAYIVLGAVLLMLIVLNLLWQEHWLDSDMAAEMIFSRLLNEEGSLIASKNWYYSTEFRVFYTQLVMAPLFSVLNDWHAIRTITNLVFYGFLLWSYFYFMRPLEVRRNLTVLSACVLLLPFSETMMTHMQMGNTYLAHLILCFWFFGMFLRLSQGTVSGWKKALLLLVYAMLGIVLGISGVRYLLVLECPMVLSAVLMFAGNDTFDEFRKDCQWKRLAVLRKKEQGRFLFYSLFGALFAVLGYGINVLFVTKQYVFQTYGATNFIAIYQGVLFERLQNAIGCLLMLFGYIPEKGFLSLRGMVTIAAFVLLFTISFAVIKTVKFVRTSRAVCAERGVSADTDEVNGKEENRKFVTYFVCVSFVLNFFVFVFTTSTMVPRYYLPILAFALPVLAFYLEQEPHIFDRRAVAFVLVCCLGLGTAKTVASFVTTDKNAIKKNVAEFLAENSYDFGFATYSNANIITEMTDGEVEIANIGDPEYLDYFRWSSPMKYYEESYHEGEVFLLVTAEEKAACEKAEAFEVGNKVYDDGVYLVYVFESREALMACAAAR